MAIHNSQPLAAASTAASDQIPSPQGAPGFAVAPEQVGHTAPPPSLQGAPEFGMAQVRPAAAPSSLHGATGFAFALQQVGPAAATLGPQSAPGFAVVSQQGAPMEAPMSPEGPPGFWLPPRQVATPQVAPVKAPPQQHFAPVMMPDSLQAPPMGATAPMPLQAPSMAALQPSQSTAPPPSLPMGIQNMMGMQQAQIGHMIASPSLPLGPPPMMMQQQPPQINTVMVEHIPQPIGLPPMMQLQQPPQACPAVTEQPPQLFGPPPLMQQQPPQASALVMEQPPQPFGPPPLMQQQPLQADPMMMPQPHLSAPPCKRQRFDQYDMSYGQYMTGHQQEMTMSNAPSYGSFLQNGLPCPPNASSTLYIEGLPNDCTTREVAHIFRQYMGFREVRLVNRAPTRQLICFVDFATPDEAFLAMGSLQGYKFDQQDHRSPKLKLQFSHSPRVASYGTQT